MDLAVPAIAPPILPIHHTSLGFPVNNVYCVGRNYADHAVEMGHDPNREPPFFFMKPRFSVLAGGGELQYPALTEDVHHEVELVLALSSGGQNITQEQASACVYGYAVGLDLTRRDLQTEAKSAGRPWDAGKVFLHSAPCSGIVPMPGEFLEQGDIQLRVNGEVKQSGNINQIIWKLPEIVSRLSELFPLYPGDLIFTGTPAGVGPIKPGDKLRATAVNMELDVEVR